MRDEWINVFKHFLCAAYDANLRPMKLLAISGSTRRNSTNTRLLTRIRHLAPTRVSIDLFGDLESLPIFSPDKEGPHTPDTVTEFINSISGYDGIIISCPEYVRAIPGGLKNAIDWLVSHQVIIAKPIILVHASHRGEDMLASLRMVLGTISSRFNSEIFAKVPLMSKSPDEINEILNSPSVQTELSALLHDFINYIDTSDA